LGEFSLLPYSVISAKKNKQSIKIHTINNINTITKYKEFKEKKGRQQILCKYYAILFRFQTRAMSQKKGLRN